MSREKYVITSTNYYTGPTAKRANASRKKPIKVQKTVVKNKKNKTVTKVTDYSPMSTYGTQKKTTTKTVVKK